MGYRILADAAMVTHFAFIGYVVVGGFLAWHWPRMLWPHLAAGVWGVLILTAGVECPLTAAENWARDRAGGNRLPPSGFIDHYIEGVLYPERYTLLLQLLAVACVLASWYVPLRRRLTHPAPRRGNP
ncbi:DUF2784 domain-containing protein [Yinghuangia sp. YIM S09857]|uniref:DUF2784 domain-containing protein n=1 Tax=Yinghuangia sp. YIM S09857 TaxID=3436929 RepID=UPI003F53653B